jgi:hypothetical protein
VAGGFVGLVSMVQANQPSHPLWTASQSRLQIPSSSECWKKCSGFRAFSNAAPCLWNELPLHLRQSGNLLAFRLCSRLDCSLNCDLETCCCSFIVVDVSWDILLWACL